MVGALQRIWSSVVSKEGTAEGQYRPGPYQLPVTGGWLPNGAAFNWWQQGHMPLSFGAHSAIVEACVSSYSQTVAMCPGDHWRSNEKGGRNRVTNSALSRILKHPNDYQSISDFLLNATRCLYLDGNAYAYCVRNSRFEISELHLMSPRASRGLVSYTGEVFYELAGNWIAMQRFGPLPRVPARDVLHIRMHQGRRENPLLGESPLVAAWLDAMAGDAIKQQQLQFYLNQAKPGIVLSTDLLLDKVQVSALRDRWNEQTTGENSGGTPILTGGLKPVAVPVMSSRDAQLADVMKMSKEDIALVYRIPLQLLGLLPGSGGNTETLMQQWIATGLGFCLNHIEESFGVTFALIGQPNEYVEFDTTALLRTAFKDRMDALTKAVQGGVMAPNEARNLEGYDDVPFGDEPRVQQQLVPLSAAASIPTLPSGQPTIKPAPPAPPAPPQPGAARSPPNDASKSNSDRILAYSRRIARQQRANGLST